ncbi:hypothetical protein Tsubulata_012243 [Turnera subulata]|uniref:Uncharacterized protein n=1 Tax=Turnera subulata TaxID=218843 RepID=A0A9Q0JNX3_9ROSI|nr:hypothetical protein Tsubulata_012243 [Turnera subulata]
MQSCLRLERLPEEGLSSTLSRLGLDISACPLLEKRYEREKGEDWPKISHIPNMFNFSHHLKLCAKQYNKPLLAGEAESRQWRRRRRRRCGAVRRTVAMVESRKWE